ncbi:hypothetical protein QBC46DRAFT_450414 [Diplogelasinospora grovesii]|uniref:Uncharacterized protein n=1 Tax=Diplogelasinospora grovesii TaxID=303347 RepID=A0AAN6N7W3_9PEZI|nr:hypothetical protein QBC46DRAFT_450414 [Diplogelasinospora grovesii]
MSFLTFRSVPLVLLGATTSLSALTHALPTIASHDNNFAPSEEIARQNDVHIFNAVHSAMRQWGSSLNHNGMSLILAAVPEGVLFYHGTHKPNPPPGPEWLAFEIEHSEGFSRPFRPPPPRPPPGDPPGPPPQFGAQVPMSMSDGADRGPPGERDGYLHIYRTTQPLHLLYVDGMGAGKTDMGTLDTQDLLLRGTREDVPWNEQGRASGLRNFTQSLGLNGIVRMEAGFEVIYCDFADGGIELQSAYRRPEPEGPGNVGNRLRLFEYMRAVSQRYHGIGAGRAVLDFGSMVSAFWYPLNLTTPQNAGGELLPRLTGATEEQLDAMRARVQEVTHDRLGKTYSEVDWQGVVDMIITRYADRLQFLATKVEDIDTLRGEVNNLLNIYIDYSQNDDRLERAVERCAEHYLPPLPTNHTQEDRFILAAIRSVTAKICSTLFQVRDLMVDPDADEGEAPTLALAALRDLVHNLRWTNWKECPQPCEPDEVCFVAMWPFGDVASHEQPTCRNVSVIDRGGPSYWRHPSPPPYIVKMISGGGDEKKKGVMRGPPGD